MPNRKKQHYVPISYLKLFSHSEDERFFSIYVKSSKIYREKALISNQAKEDYFYGKDGKIEEALGTIEGQSIKSLKKIIALEKVPKRGTGEYAAVLISMLFQLIRTKDSADSHQEMFNQYIRAYLKTNPEFAEYSDSASIKFGNLPSALLSKQILGSVAVTADLECKLIINDTSSKLMTSDNPVSLHNQFLERKKSHWSKTGLKSKGIQIFYPISPNHCLLFYDSKIYKVGPKKQFTIRTVSVSDINMLNMLQMINCYEVLYFTGLSEHHVSQLHLQQPIIDAFKRIGKLQTVWSEEIMSGKYLERIYLKKENIEFSMCPSFIKETDFAKQYKISPLGEELREL